MFSALSLQNPMHTPSQWPAPTHTRALPPGRWHGLGLCRGFCVFAGLWHVWRTSSARPRSTPSARALRDAAVHGCGGARLECVPRPSDDGPRSGFLRHLLGPETSCRSGGSGETDSSGQSAGSAGALKGTVFLRLGGLWQSLCSPRSGSSAVRKAWHPPDGSRRSPRRAGLGRCNCTSSRHWLGMRGSACPAAVPVFLSPHPSCTILHPCWRDGVERPPPGSLRPEQTREVEAARRAVLGQTGLWGRPGLWKPSGSQQMSQRCPSAPSSLGWFSKQFA